METLDTHMILESTGNWIPEHDPDTVFERAKAGELSILYRQQSRTLLGRPRYIYYWQELDGPY